MPASLARWRQLPSEDRRLVLVAAARLVANRLAVAVLPFRRIAAHLGEPGPADAEGAAPADPAAGAEARAVGAAVRRASKAVPFAASCLAQAMTAQQLLARRGVSSTIRLGLDRDGGNLAAHAWLTCGVSTITGDEVRAAFVPVASFTSRP